MIRRFRLFVLALLIPAYGLAAVGVAAFLPGVEPSAERMVVDGHGHRLQVLLTMLAAQVDRTGSAAFADVAGASVDASDRGDRADHDARIGLLGADADDLRLLLELGDTSDDVYDHCVPHIAVVRIGAPRVMPPVTAATPGADIWPPRMLRPPNASATTA